ncbi:DUF6328 family protein [Aquihabitans sp. McL0605]|uniref:DUF6328 family protein n=1 Tax=Aquihabitans sp. McL0605 TaxID=3415671 RepID=UPI003CEF8D5E
MGPVSSDSDSGAHPAQAPREESEPERLNRELDQLLGELRVALPGVQVLFAFLLTVPFTDRFHDLPTSARDVYFAAVTLVALASILLIAPTVHHRLRFRRGIKEEMIMMANHLALAGTACLGLGLGAAIYVAGEAAFPGSWVRWFGPLVIIAAILIWYVIPLGYHSRRHGPIDER